MYQTTDIKYIKYTYFLQGDSGGPLQVKNSKEKYELAGNAFLPY